ncbi:hypothetical protein C9374_007514 [Naegleria lovaniensis]|uniref:Adenylate kinase active site lid domain-containing protein n=1 Tax=Naegleria lovaniensis TaxID=51637 RepID=A0AA88KHA8_NAELO|nr:uncharacterized protein C9374_007514 [Naegleria lovaniensis]KAG2379375.1 hypothetical protein C9374_007514 [Naegleria lovaniensis]
MNKSASVVFRKIATRSSSSLIVSTHQSRNFSSQCSSNFAEQSTFKKGVLLVGRPGAGKGTYASRAAEQLNIPHIAAGDIIREEIKNKTKIGLEMQSYTSKGALVPDELVIDLLVNKITQSVAGTGKGFILDGFPRTISQAIKLDSLSDKIKLDLVLNLHQDEDIIIAKISNRRVCSNCGQVYNFAHIKRDGLDMPPLVPKVEGICDGCGAKDSLVQRDDDREEVVQKRLVEYDKLTSPLLEFYQKKGLLKTFVVNGGAKALMPSFLKVLTE